jgi:hypothetical protein
MTKEVACRLNGYIKSIKHPVRVTYVFIYDSRHLIGPTGESGLYAFTYIHVSKRTKK